MGSSYRSRRKPCLRQFAISPFLLRPLAATSMVVVLSLSLLSHDVRAVLTQLSPAWALG